MNTPLLKPTPADPRLLKLVNQVASAAWNVVAAMATLTANVIPHKDTTRVAIVVENAGVINKLATEIHAGAKRVFDAQNADICTSQFTLRRGDVIGNLTEMTEKLDKVLRHTSVPGALAMTPQDTSILVAARLSATTTMAEARAVLGREQDKIAAEKADVAREEREAKMAAATAKRA